jgi:hypothetical protein
VNNASSITDLATFGPLAVELPPPAGHMQQQGAGGKTHQKETQSNNMTKIVTL